MTQVNLADYKDIYLQTAREYIDIMFSCLTKLSDNLQDEDAINALHISSHSLRSQSQVMEFTDIANTCLNIEKISEDALKGTVQLNNKTILETKKKVEELNEILRFAQDDTGQ